MSKFINKMMMAAMTFAILATGCSDNNNSDSGQATTEKMTTVSAGDDFSEPAEEKENNAPVQAMKKSSDSELFSGRDLNPDYSSPDAHITLKGDTAQADGKGVSVDGGAVTITDEGIYMISGTLDDGRIIVDADGCKVQLVLDGADINCSDSSAVYIANAKKTFITLADGTENSISDGKEYTDTESDSAIYSHDSLTINGNGSLTVNANYNDGIFSKDDIVITGGNITVSAVNNAIKAKDYIAVADGELTLTAGGNGMKTTNSEDATIGFIYTEGGTFNIKADGDGIQAENFFNAVGGTFDIISGGGSAEAPEKQNNDFGGRGFDFDFSPENMPEDFKNFDFDPGNMPGTPPEKLAYNADNADNSAESTTSIKGIKANSGVEISGGTFNIDSAGDAVHSNGDVKISGGAVNAQSGNKGIHANSKVEINGGDVTVSKSYEGIEATVIEINDGNVEIKSSDDGFNASDGTTNQSGMGTYTEATQININGGMIYINAYGDGMDSNGDITINGGTVIVNGSVSGADAGLDGNGNITINGGIVACACISGMVENPDSQSAQNCVSVTFDKKYDGGTLVTLTDDSGNEIISFKPEKTFDNLIISSPDIQNGKTYTFYTEGTTSAGEKYGLYEKGGYKNDGTESGGFTADDKVSCVGEQSGFMGRGKPEMPDGDFDPGNMPEMPDGDFRGGKPGGRGGFKPDGMPEKPDAPPTDQ